MCSCPTEFLSKSQVFCKQKPLLIAKGEQCDCREAGMCRADQRQDTSHLLGMHSCWGWTLQWALQTLGMGSLPVSSSCFSPGCGQSQHRSLPTSHLTCNATDPTNALSIYFPSQIYTIVHVLGGKVRTQVMYFFSWALTTTTLYILTANHVLVGVWNFWWTKMQFLNNLKLFQPFQLYLRSAK